MIIKAGIPIQKISCNIEKKIPSLMKDYNIPGLSLVIIKNSKILLNFEFGVKNKITQEPITLSTVFEAASLSKTIIAYVALQMCKAKVLNLDRPLRAYLSKPYHNDPSNLSIVTLRHILSHTAGFPTSNLKIDETLKLEFLPGTHFNYSGESFQYLGFVIEQISGVPLAKYIEDTVFNPLGMTDSSFIWKNSYNVQSATPHNQQGVPVTKWKPKKAVASFSLHTTSIDFSKFLIAVIQESKHNIDQEIPHMLDISIHINKNIAWGLGWGIEKTVDRDLFWHSGDNGGFQCIALGCLAQEFGFVLMTNSTNGHKLYSKIFDLLLGGVHPLITWEEFDSNELIEENQENYLSNWWKFYDI